MTTAPESMTHEDAVRTMATERYLLDEMPDVERLAFETHFFECADCAEDLRIADLMRAGARDAGKNSSVIVPFPRTKRSTVIVPWAIAASMALVAAYQRVSVPRLDQPYALEPVTLRAAARGAEAVVRLRPGDRAAVLAIDADAPAGVSDWFYELRTGDGRQVTTGRARVPAPGIPLLLLVPASSFASAGRYTLSLRERQDATPVADYQFDVVIVNTSNGAQ